MQQRVGTGHQPCHLRRRAELIDHRHVVRHHRRHRRTHQQQVIAAAQALHAVEQHRQVFFLGAASGENQQMGIFIDAQFCAQARVPCIGMEGVQVDTQGLDENVLHPQGNQFFGHDPARRQHPVEITV
ncbi:hypothetical protein D9M73_261740 [compost metagenome]